MSNKGEILVEVEKGEEEEIDENVPIGELAMEQLRGILMEGIQKGIEEVFPNLWKNKQTVYPMLVREEELVQREQRDCVQEKTPPDAQNLNKINVEESMVEVEKGEEEEIDGNVPVDELAMEQLRGILMEGIQKGIEEAFPNLGKNKQTVYPMLVREEELVQREQRDCVQEKTPPETQKLNKINVEEFMELKSERKYPTKCHHLKNRRINRDYTRYLCIKMRHIINKRIYQKKLIKTIYTKLMMERRGLLGSRRIERRKITFWITRSWDWCDTRDNRKVKIHKEHRHLKMLIKIKRLLMFKKKYKIYD
ncbi:UNVERIFIED_CONTAM: hypothetical protein K2H54_074114 [Gekko kuhli]